MYKTEHDLHYGEKEKENVICVHANLLTYFPPAENMSSSFFRGFSHWVSGAVLCWLLVSTGFGL